MAQIEPVQVLREAQTPPAYGKGIASILIGVFLLSLGDALVKGASDRFAIGQLFALRSFLAIVLIVAVGKLFVRRRRSFRLVHPGWVTCRSLLLCGMWFFYYGALPSISFATAAAAMYTAPLFMAVFARIFLGQRITLRTIVALISGMVGIVLILRPAPSVALSPMTLLPFGAAACYAMAAIVTWRYCRGESAIGMAINLNLCLGISGVLMIGAMMIFAPALAPAPGAMDAMAAQPFLTSAWQGLSGGDWALIGLLAAMIAVIAIAVAHAYQQAPAPIIGMFDNFYLVFATLWSALLFDDLPDARALGGIGLILAAAFLASVPGRVKRCRVTPA